LDIAKTIALGATLGGLAGPFLKAAVESADAVVDQIQLFQQIIKVTMFSSGCENLQDLSKVIERTSL